MYSGVCDGMPSPDGSQCNDGNDCTSANQCQGEVCVGTLRPDGAPCDGGTCDAKPCWIETSKGYKYKSKMPSVNGATGESLGAGDETARRRPSSRPKARASTCRRCPRIGALVVQLVNETSGACWTATYSAPFAKNDGVNLSDKAD